MTYSIIKSYIPGLPQKPYRNGVAAYEMVVAHATADYEATDENELTYFTREWAKRQAFPHTFADWDSITELADPKYKAWGAGNANSRAVHVELCQTKDPEKFRASYARWTWVIAYYLFQRKLGVKDGVTLVSHDWVSKNLGGTDHTDPIGYLQTWGVSWAQVVADVAAAYHNLEGGNTMGDKEKELIRAMGITVARLALGQPVREQTVYIKKIIEEYLAAGGQ